MLLCFNHGMSELINKHICFSVKPTALLFSSGLDCMYEIGTVGGKSGNYNYQVI